MQQEKSIREQLQQLCNDIRQTPPAPAVNISIHSERVTVLNAHTVHFDISALRELMGRNQEGES